MARRLALGLALACVVLQADWPSGVAVAGAAADGQVTQVTARLARAGDGTAPGKEWSLGSQGRFEEAVALTHTSELTVEVEVQPKEFVAAQKLFVLTHSERGKLSAAKFAGSQKEGKIVFKVTSAEIKQQVGTLGGDFDAELVIADASMAKPWKHDLGKISVQHTPKQNGDAAADPPLLYHEIPESPRPDFGHIMREPEKRPPRITSMAFTMATFCPLGLLILRLSSLGVNFKRMTGGIFVDAVLFHSSVASILGLLVYYWLALPLLKMLPIFGALSAAASLFGFRLLSGLANKDKKA